MDLSTLIARAREAGLDERTIDLAEQGDATAQCDLAGCYIGLPYGNAARGELRWVRKKDPVEAVAWYRKAAEQDFATAQFNLGDMYEGGRGVPQDDVQAVAWYRKAAEQGLAGAQSSLGECYGRGAGVERDPVEEVAWYRKAAEQDFAGAQYHLVRCYKYGRGVERDLVKAGAWFRKADKENRKLLFPGERVTDSLSTLYDNCSEDDTDTVETVALYRKGAEQGFGSAQYHLGRCYQYGAGVERDLIEAAAWYQKAAEQRIFKAAYELGVMYANGRGVRKNNAEAVRWYRAAGHHAKAKHNLKVMYADGRAVPEGEDEDGWKHDDATIDF
jgi:hypothetical protein